MSPFASAMKPPAQFVLWTYEASLEHLILTSFGVHSFQVPFRRNSFSRSINDLSPASNISRIPDYAQTSHAQGDRPAGLPDNSHLQNEPHAKMFAWSREIVSEVTSRSENTAISQCSTLDIERLAAIPGWRQSNRRSSPHCHAASPIRHHRRRRGQVLAEQLQGCQIRESG